MFSNAVLVIGESGSGKSTSLRNLDPSTTFIINVLNKPLPFKGFSKGFKRMSADGKEGNYYSSDDAGKILRVVKMIDKNRPDISTIIIDDFQYVMGNEFVKRATEKGFNKFSEIQLHAWEVLESLTTLRDGLNAFVLSHSEITTEGKTKMKTIGKMLDDKITLEGMFTTVLHSVVIDGQYKFVTNTDGVHLAKSPMGMFPLLIPNDLNEVIKIIHQYSDDEDATLYRSSNRLTPETRESLLLLIEDIDIEDKDYINTIVKKGGFACFSDITEEFAKKWIAGILAKKEKENDQRND